MKKKERQKGKVGGREEREKEEGKSMESLKKLPMFLISDD